MVGRNCEFELEMEIAKWRSSSACDTQFTVSRGYVEMRMKGLLWSIEAAPQPDNAFEFTHIQLKCSQSPKVKLLLVTLRSFIRTVSRVKELLDKLYSCSLFLSMAEKDKRWWVIVDAEIMAAACKAAAEATQQAAKAAAIFLGELPIEFLPPGELIMATPEFSDMEIWNCMAEAAVNGGNVHHWCKVHVLMNKMVPLFEFEVAAQEFLQGNNEICEIRVLKSSALKVTVRLEDEIWVDCSQAGVEPGTSHGLDFLLPQLIIEYITANLKDMGRGGNGVNSIVEGLLQRVVGYLTFWPRVCEVCGNHRLMEVNLTGTCSCLCEARRNTSTLPSGLSTLLLTDDADADADVVVDVDVDDEENGEEPFN